MIKFNLNKKCLGNIFIVINTIYILYMYYFHNFALTLKLRGQFETAWKGITKEVETVCSHSVVE